MRHHMRLNGPLVTLLPQCPSLTLLPYSFGFALAGACRLVLPLGLCLPQASVSSAVLRRLRWGPFPASSCGYLTQMSSLSREFVTCHPIQERTCTRAGRNPHCAACAVVTFSASRGQPRPTHLLRSGLLAGSPSSFRQSLTLLGTLGPPQAAATSALYSTLNSLAPETSMVFWNVPRQCLWGLVYPH